MLKTFVVHVENKPGVLTRVASLFRRRAFNIDSLTVGRTEKPEVSRMTITVEADQDQARRIEASLYKLVNVLLVEDITDEPAITRDLAMIKVAAQHDQRSHVLQLVNVFRARVVDVAPESLIIEITGAEEKIDRLLEVLRPFGVLEMVRTGIVAMRRGSQVLHRRPARGRTGRSHGRNGRRRRPVGLVLRKRKRRDPQFGCAVGNQRNRLHMLFTGYGAYGKRPRRIVLDLPFGQPPRFRGNHHGRALQAEGLIAHREVP